MKFLILFLLINPVIASEFNIFTQGEILDSSKMNENFQKVQTKHIKQGMFTNMTSVPVNTKFHSFNYNKISDNTQLKISYLNNFRVKDANSFQVEILVNGQNCVQPLRFDMYNASNAHLPTLLEGVCELSSPTSGIVTIDFYTRTTGHSGGYGDVFIGWKDSHLYKLEVEEVYISNSLSEN